MTNHDPLLLVGRVLASVLFIVSGFSKLMGAAATKAYFVHAGVPLPELAYYVAVAVELGGGLLFLVGFQTRLVALGLAVFSIVTALLAHTDFAQPGQLINFEKNLCMAGGFLAFVAAGAGRFSLDGMRVRRPAMIGVN